MAIPFVVLHGKLDRATRVRLAVLSGTAFNDSARLITIEDVQNQREYLSNAGLCVSQIVELANVMALTSAMLSLRESCAR